MSSLVLVPSVRAWTAPVPVVSTKNASSKNAPPAPLKDGLGQISVYAPAESVRRETLEQLAEFSSRAGMLHSALRLRDFVWNTLGIRRVRPPACVPIQILRLLNAPSGVCEVDVVGGGAARTVRIRVSEAEDPGGEPFKRSMVVAVIRELMLRPSASESSAGSSAAVPRWLVDALVHQERVPDFVQLSDELLRISEHKVFPCPLKELLARPEPYFRESTLVEILAARCFLNFLMTEPDRGGAVLTWLQADPVRIGPAFLSRYFSWLGKDEVQVEKAWTVHLASLRAQRARVSMTAAETKAELERLLQMDVVLPGNLRRVAALEDFEEYVRLPGIEPLMRARRLELIAFAARAHFLFEPLIHSYANLCGEIADRRTKGLGDKFRRLRAEWDHAESQVNRAHDYLNWWESLPQSPEPAAHLKDFYRELDSGEAFRSKASQVLDLWEQRLKKKESREDWMRLLEEVDRRPKGGK
jgi:hypothetical protein